LKQESTSPVARPVQLNAHEAETTRLQAVVDDAVLEKYPQLAKGNSHHPDAMLVDREMLAGQNSYASPPAFQADGIANKELTATVSKLAATLVSPPTSLADEMDIHDQVDGEGEHAAALYTPSSGSRHSSRQPRQVERYMPEVHFVKTIKSAGNPQPARRSSFSAASTAMRKSTPGASSGPRKSASRPSSSHGKKSMSPSVEKKFERHAASSASPSQQSRGPKLAEDDADAESMRLIREIQEQEFGLRRRAGRV
jgi:F-box/leucine-rich repeat protein 10/11